jgi:hypothetical protein
MSEEGNEKFAVQKLVALRISVLSAMTSRFLVLLRSTALAYEQILCDVTCKQFALERNPIDSTVTRVASHSAGRKLIKSFSRGA